MLSAVPASAAMPSPLLTVKEACERLGRISRTTLFTIVKSGRLPAVRIGARRVFFEASTIDAYIACCRTGSRQ